MPSEQARLLMIVALSAYAAAAITTVLSLRADLRKFTLPFLLILTVGLVLNAVSLVARAGHGHWPLGSGFDTFSLLALIVAVMSLYLKLLDSGRAAELALLPAAIACCVFALALSAAAYRDFARAVWHAAHVVFAMTGMLCFAAASGAGAIYLQMRKRLQRKDPAAFESHWPSLERLDRFIRHAMPVGFALLTATIVLGLYGGFLADRAHWVSTWWKHPKMVISLCAWALYAVALHAAYGRRFRGPRAAKLSIAGLVLLVIVLLVSILLPSG